MPAALKAAYWVLSRWNSQHCRACKQEAGLSAVGVAAALGHSSHGC